jgi:hypothetical protein
MSSDSCHWKPICACACGHSTTTSNPGVTERSGADINIEIAQRLQERFETYWLGLIFTLLAASIQTATFGAVPMADAMELAAWIFLLIAGLAGLSRFEWIPEIYRLKSIQIEKEDLARTVHKEQLKGMQEVYVAPLKKTVSASQYVTEAEASARTVERHLEPIERRQMWKYRVKKWSFVIALCLLVAARAYIPVTGIVHALRR